MKLKLLFSIPFTLMLTAVSLSSIAAVNGTGLSDAPASPFLPQDSIKAPSAPPAPPLTVPQPSPALKGPSVATWCSAGGCLDSSGNWYSGGAGNLYLNNSGNACVRSGSWLQCN
jgi:hypothetical protein